MSDNRTVGQVPGGARKTSGVSPCLARDEERKRAAMGSAEPALRPLIPAEDISERVTALGKEIAEAIPPGDLVVVGVLRGAFIFMADLVRALPRPHMCDFLAVRSYGDATETSGVVEITSDLSLPIEGKHVLLVEDIVDTGLTLKYLIKLLDARRPSSLRVAALLSKP